MVPPSYQLDVDFGPTGSRAVLPIPVRKRTEASHVLASRHEQIRTGKEVQARDIALEPWIPRASRWGLDGGGLMFTFWSRV